MMTNKALIIVNLFNEHYPNPKPSLNFSNLYQLVIAVILSAQTTDKAVNKITPKLFEKYSSFKELAQANDISDYIKSLGLYLNKAKYLKELALILQDREFPSDFNEMLKLPGIGRKTASVISIEYFKLPMCPVDTHVNRISHRLGISKAKSLITTQKDIEKYFNKECLRDLHHQLIFFGRDICKSLKPKCLECYLKDYCIEFKKSKIS
ncbi:MAG: endonuclease III [Bacillales bacterium]|jgi:endonuclease-3|nr:endonuclease III [Bacillales bacterium]